ncbi:MAG: hypothetical protein M3229_03910 [Actinomycetota bacterium]|nr:hypothetical protein [Actinomycetota bacterium]
MRSGILAGAIVWAALAAAPALASQPLADFNVRDLKLAVNARGEALLTYARESGAPRRLLAWGAVNARPPSSGLPQVRFSYDYAGGWGKYRKQVWRTFRSVCGRYRGPELPYLVAACTAPDGSHWAVQSWQRLLPMRGFDPWTAQQAGWELHLSHWSGPLPVLEVSPNWTYGGRWQGVFGRLTYEGAPVHGVVGSNGGRYTRYAYIDTFDSVYGPGWRHDAGKALHLRNGAFCFSFVPQVPPPGYPSREPRGPGNGERHRVSVMGPGVTPVVTWEGAGLGRYNAVQDEVYNELFDRIVGPDDKVCAAER